MAMYIQINYSYFVLSTMQFKWKHSW